MRNLTKLLAVAGTLALASCGGSDDDKSDKADKTTPTATTAKAEVTRASYIAAADAFCKQSNAKAKVLNERLEAAINSQTTDEARLAAAAPILKEGYGVGQRRNKAFAAIPSPAADSATIDRLEGGYRRRTTLVAQLVDAATRQDVKRFASVGSQSARLAKKVRKIAKAYGLRECGSRKNEAP